MAEANTATPTQNQEPMVQATPLQEPVAQERPKRKRRYRKNQKTTGTTIQQNPVDASNTLVDLKQPVEIIKADKELQVVEPGMIIPPNNEKATKFNVATLIVGFISLPIVLILVAML